MPGLDKKTIGRLDFDLSLRRIATDIHSDFIFSPHYSAIFTYLRDELKSQASSLLAAGDFEPSLPITIEVPKPSGITRRGTILPPIDRLIYQSLVDLIAPIADTTIDPNRSFSHRLIKDDPEDQMFEPSQACWTDLIQSVAERCNDPKVNYAIRADVASFFDTVDQHALVNLLQSSNCDISAVNLLEKLLSAWRERSSRGILQGMFPSDFLGNFYLCGLDGELEVAGIPSARYVDDIYLFFADRPGAQEGLVKLCSTLRRDGLFLNERKTSIMRAEDLLHEETHLDKLFSAASAAAEQEAFESLDPYILHTAWDPTELYSFFEPQDLELQAFENLFNQIGSVETPTDKIERLCLPFLGRAGSDIAIDYVLQSYTLRPHQAKLYSSYFAYLARLDKAVTAEIEALWKGDSLVYDWQRLWLAVALAYLPTVTQPAVTVASRIVSDRSISMPLRAVCAQLVAKHGNAARKRALRTLYQDEPSDYIRGALLFATQFFPTAERKACLRAWGGHSTNNALIAQAVRKIVAT